MEYLNDKASILADILMDFDFNNNLGSFSLDTEEDNSDLVINSLVKSITKRKKEDPIKRRILNKACKAPKRNLTLETPTLFRTDDTTYFPSVPAQLE